MKKGLIEQENVIQYLLRKHNPLNYDHEYLPETKEIRKVTVAEAFEGAGNDMPF
jgi:hypothetical protein